jgi:uncharacterized protein YgbK (DUF1537 family)
VETAAARGAADVIAVPADARDWEAVLDRTACALRGGAAILWYSPHIELPQDESARTMSGFFAGLVKESAPPARVVVTGGDTLERFCRAAEMEALFPRGEIFPGIPLSIARGGRWDGVSVVSKSGAYGDDTTLARLLSMTHGEKA